MEACHFPDRNPMNSNLDNLRWATRASNVGDKVKHGTQPMGSKTGHAKLTEDQVREIRKLYRKNKRDGLAKRFGVLDSAIRDVVERKTWKHIS
jgi:hypothetical protein